MKNVAVNKWRRFGSGEKVGVKTRKGICNGKKNVVVNVKRDICNRKKNIIVNAKRGICNGKKNVVASRIKEYGSGN